MADIQTIPQGYSVWLKKPETQSGSTGTLGAVITRNGKVVVCDKCPCGGVKYCLYLFTSKCWIGNAKWKDTGAVSIPDRPWDFSEHENTGSQDSSMHWGSPTLIDITSAIKPDDVGYWFFPANSSTDATVMYYYYVGTKKSLIDKYHTPGGCANEGEIGKATEAVRYSTPSSDYCCGYVPILTGEWELPNTIVDGKKVYSDYQKTPDSSILLGSYPIGPGDVTKACDWTEWNIIIHAIRGVLWKRYYYPDGVYVDSEDIVIDETYSTGRQPFHLSIKLCPGCRVELYLRSNTADEANRAIEALKNPATVPTVSEPPPTTVYVRGIQSSNPCISYMHLTYTAGCVAMAVQGCSCRDSTRVSTDIRGGMWKHPYPYNGKESLWYGHTDIYAPDSSERYNSRNSGWLIYPQADMNLPVPDTEHGPQYPSLDNYPAEQAEWLQMLCLDTHFTNPPSPFTEYDRDEIDCPYTDCYEDSGLDTNPNCPPSPVLDCSRFSGVDEYNILATAKIKKDGYDTAQNKEAAVFDISGNLPSNNIRFCPGQYWRLQDVGGYQDNGKYSRCGHTIVKGVIDSNGHFVVMEGWPSISTYISDKDYWEYLELQVSGGIDGASWPNCPYGSEYPDGFEFPYYDDEK